VNNGVLVGDPAPFEGWVLENLPRKIRAESWPLEKVDDRLGTHLFVKVLRPTGDSE